MEPPHRWTIIMAPARSGSTWLFDALRAHPLAHFRQDAELFRLLGFDRFNRFPRDLCGSAGASLQIELRPDLHAVIHASEPPDELRRDAETNAEHTASPRRWIEKIHPEMFRFKPAEALDLLKRVEDRTGVPVDLVYRVRHPLETIRSMFGYKRRNPSWYPHLPESRIVPHVEASLSFLGAMVERRPGIMIDHREQLKRPAESLERLYSALWAKLDPDLQCRIALWATERSDRTEEAPADARGFFATGAPGEDETAHLESMLSAHPDAIDACLGHYEFITAGSGSPAPSPIG